MADKQATIYIVDLGVTTRECHNGRIESDLDYGMRYVWGKITKTMAGNRKGWNVGVMGLRTEETNNKLGEEEGYEHISVLKPLGEMLLPDLRQLQENIQSSDTNEGDAISAIVLAIDSIEEFTTLKSGKPGKFARKIVLLTDGEGTIDDEEVDAIVERIDQVGIELVIIGIDFDDAEFGFKEEDKSEQKRSNEVILKAMTEACKAGTFGTVAAALEYLSVPEVKVTRPYPTYKGKLTLGDCMQYPETAMAIDVERYFRTKTAKPDSATSFTVKSGANGANQIGDTEMPDAPGSELSGIKTTRTYRVNDAEHPGGKRDVDKEELAKGYEYGRTAVHMSESDENVTTLETKAGFEIIGFIPEDKHQTFLNLGESCITVPMATNEKARIALSSFVRSLHELESYAVARLVAKDGKDIQMLLLAPSIEPDLEALIDIPLPFAEDVRIYRFPPLDRVITTSGATLTTHRNLPNEHLVNSMSAYVDSMDISSFGKDEDGRPVEYMAIEDTYSPLIHRTQQAIQRRAVQPKEPVAPPAEILLKYTHPPEELVSEAAPELEKLVKTAGLIKVPPKVKGKRRREAITPISGLDVDSILGKRSKITPENAIADFKNMLTDIDNDGVIALAMKQFTSVVRELIRVSTGDQNYPRAWEAIGVMKEHMIELQEPGLYNRFMKELKTEILTGKLKDGREDFWFGVKIYRLGLIDNETDPDSDVSKDEASKFFSHSEGIPNRSRTSS